MFTVNDFHWNVYQQKHNTQLTSTFERLFRKQKRNLSALLGGIFVFNVFICKSISFFRHIIFTYVLGNSRFVCTISKYCSNSA